MQYVAKFQRTKNNVPQNCKSRNFAFEEYEIFRPCNLCVGV